MSLDGHWSVKIFDFMVFLYESLISYAFSFGFSYCSVLSIVNMPFLHFIICHE